MSHRLVLLASLVLSAGCGGAASTTGTTGTTGTDYSTRASAIAALSGSVSSGGALYKSTASPTCASCHLADGSGQPPTTPGLIEPAANDTDEELATAILKGGDAMKSYASSLSDQQVADLIAYLRSAFAQ
ncbi:MAG: cytochrome c [Myxococcaceae bacterium]|nr:cytochrome c [Myxococcaceae bacterium]